MFMQAKGLCEDCCYWCQNMAEVKNSKFIVHSRYEDNHNKGTNDLDWQASTLFDKPITKTGADFDLFLWISTIFAKKVD